MSRAIGTACAIKNRHRAGHRGSRHCATRVGKKTDTMELVRAGLGLGLKEAKDLVAALPGQPRRCCWAHCAYFAEDETNCHARERSVPIPLHPEWS
jgi:hypothetical protein